MLPLSCFHKLGKTAARAGRSLLVASFIAAFALTAVAGDVNFTVEYDTTFGGTKTIPGTNSDMDSVVSAITTAVADADGYIANTAVVDATLLGDHTSAIPGNGITPFWTITPTAAIGSLTINGDGFKLYADSINSSPLLVIENTNAVTFNNLGLEGGTIQGAGLAIGGGANIVTSGAFTYTTGTVTNNKITTTGGGMYADGAGLHINANSIGITDVAFNNNIARGGDASGGGMVATAANGTVISGGQFVGNQAIAVSEGKGGGLYVTGNLTLTDVILQNNVASGTTAQGGGAYVTGSVDLNVTTGVNTIQGNQVNSAYNSFHIQNGGGGNFNIDVAGSATLALLDPMTIVSSGVYNISKTGSGDLNWDGENTIDAASSTVTINGGALKLGDKFTLKAVGNTQMTVDIDDVDSITFGLGRETDLAMFDFGPQTNNGTMTVTNGTKLTTTLGRQIQSFSADYLVATGLQDAEAIQVASDLVMTDGSGGYLSFGNSPYASGSDVWAGVHFSSPFDHSGVNALSARDPLHELLNGRRAPTISDSEYYAILANARSAHPEAFMEQGFVFIDGVDMVMRSARNYGLRAPHRTRLRMEESYSFSGRDRAPAPHESYTDYGEPIVSRPADFEYQAPQTQYQAPVSAASDYAYPRLMDCAPGAFASGLRIWAGYVGEWRSVSAHSGYNGYKATRNGFLIGANYDFGSVASIGVFGGYTRNETKAKRANSEITSDTGHFGVQARFSPIESMRELSFFADIGYHWADNDMRRNLGAWGANGKFEQDGFTFSLGVEHVFNVSGFNIAPYLELRHVGVDQDGMRESGTSVTATSVGGFNKSGTNTRLGAEFSQDFVMADGMLLAPALNLAWRHEYGDKNFRSTANYIAGTTSLPFTMSSSPLQRDSVDIGLAIRMAKQLGAQHRFGANFGYNANLTSHVATHTLYIGAEFGF